MEVNSIKQPKIKKGLTQANARHLLKLKRKKLRVTPYSAYPHNFLHRNCRMADRPGDPTLKLHAVGALFAR